MNKAYLLTGGNLGNGSHNLSVARKLIEQYCGQIVEQSAFYKTAAWAFVDQPDFYNQAVAIKTVLLPAQLLQTLLTIEEKMGRVREKKMGPRIIDLDILLYNSDIIDDPQLIIPHPRMQQRMFVLAPLAEIAPDLMHPLLHKTMEEMRKDCTDTLAVYKIEQTI